MEYTEEGNLTDITRIVLKIELENRGLTESKIVEIKRQNREEIDEDVDNFSDQQ